ncbi:MAG: hypothetical protein AAGF79_14380, partial [Pseudomonadota bacterium]
MIELQMRCRRVDGADLIAATGLSTPHAGVIKSSVVGGTVHLVADPLAGQQAMVIRPEAEEICLSYVFLPGGAAYPEAMFQPRDSRYTR